MHDGAVWIAYKIFHADNDDSDLSLHCAHISEGTFSHVIAQFTSVYLKAM